MNKKLLIPLIIMLVIFGGYYLKHPTVSNPPRAAESTIVELKDGNTYEMTASIVKKTVAGRELTMLAYNGMIPGPTLKVPKGATITINFTNKTDVETTLHSHGVRLDNKFDGVPDYTQKPIKTGKTFTYKIKFPDEGIYWYHPHIREDYAQELGLYGNYIVVSDNPNYWSPVDREVPLMVDDILLDNKGISFFGSTADHALMGRFGNTMLVNGETDYKLPVKQGEVIRFMITNAANTRTFNLGVPGVKMKLVGSDGGKYEREEWANSVILGPSERAVVEVLFDKSGTYTLTHTTPTKTYTMGTFKISPNNTTSPHQAEFTKLRINTDFSKSLNSLRQYFDKPADKTLRLIIDNISMGGMNHTMPMTQENIPEKIEWEDAMGMMNQMMTADVTKWKIVDEATKKENMAIDWKFKVGDKVKIKIFNDPKSAHPMQHPIHFHGQRFLVLSTNSIKNDNLVWKDTALVQTGDTIEILLDVTNPGIWMAHCHIAEHLESGMMFNFEVTS